MVVSVCRFVVQFGVLVNYYMILIVIHVIYSAHVTLTTLSEV